MRRAVDQRGEPETAAMRRAAGVGFFFLRHGETMANRAGVRSGGGCETGLTERGRQQADAAGRALSHWAAPPGMIVSSALSRALSTAHLLNKWLKLPVRVEKGLNERMLGDWNGRTIAETQPALAAGETPPGGESEARFRARALTSFHALAPLYPHWPLIVSSRGIARVLLESAGHHQGAADVANGALLRVTLAGADQFKIVGLHRIQRGGGKKALLSPGSIQPRRDEAAAGIDSGYTAMLSNKKKA